MKQQFDTSVLDKAIIFAVKAHAGVERRGKNFPYIVHLMEATEIVATMSSDQEMLAAAMLHDVIEDTTVSYEDLVREFGVRVADMVKAESDVEIDGMSSEESWHLRKQIAMDNICKASRDEKIVALGDKLSNMRAIANDYDKLGDELWQRFHIKERKEHELHYRGLARSLSELSDTNAYKEFVQLIDRVFA